MRDAHRLASAPRRAPLLAPLLVVGPLAIACVLGGLAACSSFGEATPPAVADAETDAGGGSDATDGALTDAGADGAVADAGDGGSFADGPVMVVDNEPPLSRIVTSTAEVYYTQTLKGGDVRRVSKKPGAAATSFVAGISPTALAYQGQVLYVTSKGAGTLSAWDIMGLPGVAVALAGADAVVADATNVVAAAAGGAYRFPLLLGSSDQLTAFTAATGLAMDATSVYVGLDTAPTSHQVRRVKRQDSSVLTSGEMGDLIAALDVDGNSLYVATGSRLVVLPLAFTASTLPVPLKDFGAGTTVTTVHSGPAFTFVGVQGPAGGQIYRVPAANSGGGSPVLVSTVAGCDLPDLSVDPDSIWFLCVIGGVGSVWHVPRL